MKFGLPLTLFLVLSMALTVQASVGGDLRGEVDVQISVSGWAEVRTLNEAINLDITNPTEFIKSNEAEWTVHANTPVNITFESLGFYTTTQSGLYENFRPDKYFTYRVKSPGDDTTSYTFKPKRLGSNPEGIDTKVTRNTKWGPNTLFCQSGKLWIEYTPDPDPGKKPGWMYDDWDGWEGLIAGGYEDTVAITISEILE
ncbi:MAG: hypothetical protein GX030_03195 [Firmicutes bacterium]|nr:hypothetical protein [Bacillota bacterium]